MLKLNYVSFVVSDMQKALDFYRLLGLSISPDADTTQDHIEISVDGLRIAWETETLMRQLDRGWAAPMRGGRVSIALEAASPEEVDEAVKRIKKAGHAVKTEPFDAFWGQRYATVLDPDGTAVDVFALLE
ncbi:glyoxalase [Deinococcus piscis]|uniref:Glyoxalase n=1 Tax=Deinococcus piscis TaxID=394230 RepID=A0ABQ3KD68_9DEIO|nr:VOC family protein [Deinococcus piscis]GHG12839.1 glyoxalase [Deinococcus piscis]